MTGIQEGGSCIRRLFHAVSHVSMRRTGDTRRVCTSVLGVRKIFLSCIFILLFFSNMFIMTARWSLACVLVLPLAVRAITHSKRKSEGGCKISHAVLYYPDTRSKTMILPE